MRPLRNNPASSQSGPELAVQIIESQFAALEDLGLIDSRVYPVRRKKEEDPGFSLIGRELSTTLARTEGKPQHSGVRQNAQHCAFSGLKETATRFQESEAHSNAMPR
jgi:hypothetical protein